MRIALRLLLVHSEEVDNSLETSHSHPYLIMVAIGATAGLTSGLFGVGGGTVIVPALVWLGMTQRRSAAASMAAIIPISIVAVLSYAFHGDVNWGAGVLMALGFVIGAQIGARLLHYFSEKLLRWLFVIFILFLIVGQLISIPERDAHIDLTILTALAIIACGIVVGTLAPLLGVGGGIIMVPAFISLFSASDLIARGTSLLAMFPGAISATITNARKKLVEYKYALIIGVTACVFSPIGNLIATHLNPRTNAILFAIYLALILIRSLWAALHVPREA
ncbi:MAG: sulfite exporter TauE/SafE family protein [Actinomycetaceae bacterium]|nr:sulfite exporter TauE/SafE family protein [Actinomycetaceae bacterium]